MSRFDRNSVAGVLLVLLPGCEASQAQHTAEPEPPAPPPRRFEDQAAEPPTPTPPAEPDDPDWPNGCIEALAPRLTALRDAALRYPYSDVGVCPADLEPSSAPNYVVPGCLDRAVTGSFQGGGSEHIYWTVEELVPGPSTHTERGMMVWARDNATNNWERHHDSDAVYDLRRTARRIALVRLESPDPLSRKATAYMDALREASDACL